MLPNADGSSNQIMMDSSSHDLLRDDGLQVSFECANCSDDDEMSEEDSLMGSKVTHARMHLFSYV
jgi:hypothetical protein